MHHPCCGDSRTHDAAVCENKMQRYRRKNLAITAFSAVKQRYRCRYDCINSGIWFGIYYAFWYNATLMCGALHSFYRFSIYRSILVQPILFSTQGNGCTTKTPPPENGNSRYRVVFIYTRRSPQGNSPYCGNQFLLSKNHPPSGVLLLRCLFA